ncbi:MAG: alpha-glucoside-specific PTS transporter subunit IIBC [Brevinema sp.]
MTQSFNAKEAMQRFGAAMFVPVLLFSFSGLLVGLTIVFKSPDIVGSGIANPDGWFYRILTVLEEGGWTVFRNMPLLFCLGMPVGLSKTAPERAVMATVVCFLSFNYFIGSILTFWGSSFGVDFTQAVGGTSGLAMIAGIKTLDTSIIGGILVGFIITQLHNRFYETRLPDYLGVFQGTSFVHMTGFAAMIPLAFLTCLVWPKVQMGINSMQTFLAASGVLGVGIYTFLERILIPTGLHHFIYGPFIFGPAVVPNGIEPYWIENVSRFSQMTEPLKDLFPQGGFALHGNSKVFGSPGLALAIYFCAKPENKKAIAALLIPATLTAIIVGITEPLEFTFLFIAPALFLVHSLLAAALASALYGAGVVGNMGAGLLQFFTTNWIFTWKNHPGMIFAHIAIGLVFTLIWFVVFRYLIVKWNVPTPGRADMTVKLFTKKEFEASTAPASTTKKGGLSYEDQAAIFLEALGGVENIESVTNCATRLRVTVKDMAKVEAIESFQAGGAHGVLKEKQLVQVIVGLSVPQVRSKFESML